jgi:hypothetical protein
MRLDICPDGRCEDVKVIGIQILKTTKGMQPYRSNGPIDVNTDYGTEDCVLVAVNGAFGAQWIQRADLAADQPRWEFGGLSLADQQLQNYIKSKTPFVLEYRGRLSKKQSPQCFEVLLEVAGIYVASVELTCKDGTKCRHAIYVDAERDIVHFGRNDKNDDMIAFMIEKSDRRDVASARDSLVTRKNFPPNPNEPGRSLESMKILEVYQVLIKAKHMRQVPHAAYRIQTIARKSVSGKAPRMRLGTTYPKGAKKAKYSD